MILHSKSCNFIQKNLVPAYSSAGAGSSSYGGTGGSGLYSSNYVGTGSYGPSFPYVGGFTYAGGAPGFGYGFVPPFGFGFNNDLQNFISAQFNHLQGQFNNIARLYQFFITFFCKSLSFSVFKLIFFFGKQSNYVIRKTKFSNIMQISQNER